MARPEPEILNLAVVIIGNFNPAIFQPEWLKNKGLIRENEASPDNLKVIHPELTVIETEDFRLEVRPSRFQLQTSQEPFREPLKDLIVNIFKLLGETPISAFGVNFTRHFRFRDNKDYVNFGYFLSPIQTTFDFMEKPRLLEFTVTDRERDQVESNPVINMKIFPSDVLVHDSVAININTHFTNSMSGKAFSKFFGEIWEKTLTTSDSYLNKLWDKYTN